MVNNLQKGCFFNDFLQLGWFSGEVFVAVSDNLGFFFLGLKIVAVWPI